ncbi:MAG: tetratricopeptide repeat protein, partial [Hyphomicrobiaceae bacterium]
KSSIVRGAAAALADGAPRNDRVAHAIPFLRDKSRAVRLTAIPQVLDATRSDLRQDDLQAIASVMQEHQRALMANADFPETQMSIAGLALVLRNLPAAEKALHTAVAMDPQLGDAWLLLARVQMQARRPREAKATLRSAIAKLGGSAVLYQSLGNVLAVLRDVEGAERALKDALRLAPNDANIFLDLAALYSRALRPDDAIDQLEQLLKATPDHPQALELLALNQLAAGKLVDARDTVRRLMTRYPSYRLNRRLAPLRNLPQ